jgi:hypothetical protein
MRRYVRITLEAAPAIRTSVDFSKRKPVGDSRSAVVRYAQKFCHRRN